MFSACAHTHTYTHIHAYMCRQKVFTTSVTQGSHVYIYMYVHVGIKEGIIGGMLKELRSTAKVAPVHTCAVKVHAIGFPW